MSAPIQVVDTNDRPVRAASKQEVWDQKSLHRVVRIMLQRPDGKILLQRRSASKVPFPSCWDNSVAGHVDVGEDFETAAYRELAEEVGLTDVRLKELGRYSNAGDWQGWQSNRFQCVYTATITDTPTRLETGKVDSVRWFSLDEIKQMVREHPEQVTDGLMEVITQFYTPIPLGGHAPVVVVNDKDEVISNASLADARKLNLIYRVVFVIAKDKAGRVLLQKRAPTLTMYPDCWDVTASGHVDGGRSYEEAARAELAEEVGIKDAELTEVAHTFTDAPLWNNVQSRRFATMYSTMLSETPKDLGPHEVTEVRWFTEAEIDELLANHPEKAAEGLTLARQENCL